MSTISFTSGLNKLYPNSNLVQNKLLGRLLDTDKRGMIAFENIMNCIKENSTISKFPDPEIIKKSLKEKLKKQTFEELGFHPEEIITLPSFIKKLSAILKDPQKDLYFFYEYICQLQENNEDIMGKHVIQVLKDNIIKEDEINANESVKKEKKRDLSKIPVGLLKICSYIYPKGQEKPFMSEEAIFRQFDTNRDGFLFKIEIKKGLERKKIKITNEEIEELFKFVDLNEDYAMSLDEFIEAIRIVRGSNMLTAEIKHPTEKSPESILKCGLQKLKKYINENLKTKSAQFEDAFINYDKSNAGSLPISNFMEILNNLKIGLTKEEIEYFLCIYFLGILRNLQM